MLDLALSRIGLGRRSASWRLTPSFSAIRAGVLIAIAYYVGCLAGFGLRFPSSGIAYLWPPNAILLAALLVTPRRTWPVLLGAAFAAHGVAHANDGVPPLTWLCQFLANGLQAVLAAAIVLRFADRPLRFDTLRSMTVFVVGAAFVAPAIASLVPAYVYVQMGWASQYWSAWGLRTLTNIITTISLVPPFVLLFVEPRRLLMGAGRARAGEFAVLLLGLFAVNLVVSVVRRTEYLGLLPALSSPLPFLVWAAVRFGPGALSLSLLSVTWMSISAALGSDSPFAGGTPVLTAAAVQAFVVNWGLPLMLLSALLEEIRDARRILAVDITERKRTEEALRQSEAEKGAILRAIPDLMFVQTMDAQHRYLDYYTRNPSDLLVAPDKFLGKPMRDVLPIELARTFEHLFNQAVTSEEPAIVEYSLPIGGEDRSYEARVVAFDDHRLLSIVRDITDRKRIENAVRISRQRYALATAAGGVGVWDWNLDTNEIYLDPHLKSLLGFEDREIENHLDDWGRRVHPDDAELVMSRARSHIDGQSPSFDVEHRMIHKDGNIRWFLARGSLVSSGQERQNRMIGTDTDITERKHAEAALLTAQQDLTQMSRAIALGELAATIAHEVSQPLSAIITNAEACVRWVENGSLPSGDLREALASIVGDANRASTVITRTRELFSRGPHEKVSVELNGTIMEVLALTRAVVEQKGVSVRLELVEHELLVMGDRVQLQQVLLNLIVNAVDAMTQVTARSRVLLVRSWREHGFVCVAVRDTGHGVDPQDLERIFEPFYSTKPQGMGMGLAVSRSIIRAHGGTLLATLNEDGGATFQFTIPVAAGQDG